MSSLGQDRDNDQMQPRKAPAVHLGKDCALRLNAALSEIYSACHINDFSTAVVKHGKQLRIVADRAMFLQKAAADFQLRFVASFEEDIRAGQSWGYAKTCNAVSWEVAGQPGIEACKALAARVSRLDNDLIRKMEVKALSLLASSFGRRSWIAECRGGTIRIAEFFLDERGTVQRLNSQHLSLLMNGFSKWPQEPTSRKAAASIANEVIRRGCRRARLSDFSPQGLSTLVNGFSRWDGEERACKAIVAVAGEVRRRADRADIGLSEFVPQGLAALVNGFRKSPEQKDCRQATVAIAGEVLSRDGQLSRFVPQELANLLNGFSRWPEEPPCHKAAIAIARQVLSRGDHIVCFNPHDLAKLVNGFSKWPEETASRQAIGAIANEVLCRVSRLSQFAEQDLSNLVDGFSKWPGDAVCCQATMVIAAELVRSADRLSDAAGTCKSGERV
ncbi:hypothetical protein FBZ93_116181 [Bradyrhizobium macuxiense]|uniref:Uncharacterized protein n=1 Tax=Bradyrhizobium macuxiense TaxID=1755647 RepID=A0A560L271_9BRAD|nr:hypothetical protein [Bradyrhizobium macuxiense]TWB89462.1 hypothetical protein FBZ93_116181 [Bradyrhizobium macuxiense]